MMCSITQKNINIKSKFNNNSLKYNMKVTFGRTKIVLLALFFLGNVFLF
jgi:hypothetical protein